MIIHYHIQINMAITTYGKGDNHNSLMCIIKYLQPLG